MKNITWNDIIKEFERAPRDVSTVPTTKAVGKWFYVSTSKDDVLVSSGKNHSNVSKISVARKLNRYELEDMIDLYLRRKSGESVSRIAAEKTVNQVYWYGIFNEMGV